MKIVFCNKCLNYVPAKYVGTDENTSDRIFFGIATLGLNEILISRYYQCLYCKNLIKQ